MWSHNQRQGAVRLLLRRLLLLGLFLLVLLVVSSVWGVYQKERESSALRAEAENERADLVLRQKQLESDIATLKTDRGLEEALREQYALAEKGEKLIVIVDPPVSTPIKATSTVGEWLRKTFWWW